MKYIFIALMFALFAHGANAGNVTPKKYVKVQILQLKEEIRHLKYVVKIIKGKDRSKKSEYNKNLQANRRTVNGFLERHELTLKDFYEYGSHNEVQISQWLDANPEKAEQLRKHETRLDKLKAKHARLLNFQAKTGSGD